MTAPQPLLRGVILLAHGSRDPLWRKPIEAVAQRTQALSPAVRVACAYIEHSEPSLEQAADQLIAQGISQLTVFPLFLGMGKHARADVPSLVGELQLRHPRLRVDLKASAGEEERLIQLLAEIALEGI